MGTKYVREINVFCNISVMVAVLFPYEQHVLSLTILEYFTLVEKVSNVSASVFFFLNR